MVPTGSMILSRIVQLLPRLRRDVHVEGREGVPVRRGDRGHPLPEGRPRPEEGLVVLSLGGAKCLFNRT